MTTLLRRMPGITMLAGVAGLGLFLGPLASDLCAQPTLISNQPGVHISLSGPISVSGLAPLTLHQLPPGRYKLRGQGLGTTWVRGSITLMNNGEIQGGKEPYAYSLLIPPGLIHLTQRETVRGLFLTGAGIGGLSQVIARGNDISSAENDIQQAEAILQQAVSEETIINASNALAGAYDRESDATEMRNLWALYLGVVWVGAAVETWLFTAQPRIRRGDGESEFILDVPRVNGGSAALRSALFPGAGQRYAGRETRANFFFGGIAILGAGTLVAHGEYLEASREQAAIQRAYDSARTTDDLERLGLELVAAGDKTEDANRTQLVFLGSTIGVYLWNILDAYILGNTVRRSSDLGFSIAPRADGFRAGLTWELK